MNQTIYLITLGCEKNTVDAEHILSIVKEDGFTVVDDPKDADVIVVNTCSFIEDAKKESIDTIFDHTLYKKYGKCKKLIVSGCMSERYKEEFLKMFDEVDSAIGINNLRDILKAIKEDGYHSSPKMKEYQEYGFRENTGFSFSAYIRISDGCHAKCSFCAIPLIRGEYRSRTIENILEEANFHAKNGVKEINLIAQETTYYGYDLYKKFMLGDLLKELDKIEGIEWIRVLYHNPVVLTDDILQAFFDTKKVVPYFDIPLQHVNKVILEDMNRKGDYDSYKTLINKIRNYDENIAMRTSFIVGFPGETKEEFKEILKFVRECKLDRVGVFTYSEEENTKALLLDKEKVNNEKKFIRREKLMRVAIEVSQKRLERFVDKVVDVLVYGYDDNNDLYGRSKYDAPDVDGLVYIANNSNTTIDVGDIVQVKITHNNEYDLFGVVEK